MQALVPCFLSLSCFARAGSNCLLFFVRFQEEKSKGIAPERSGRGRKI